VARDDSRCALRAGRTRPRFHSHLAVHRSQRFFFSFFFFSLPFREFDHASQDSEEEACTRAHTHTHATFNHTLETPDERITHYLAMAQQNVPPERDTLTAPNFSLLRRPRLTQLPWTRGGNRREWWGRSEKEMERCVIYKDNRPPIAQDRRAFATSDP